MNPSDILMGRGWYQGGSHDPHGTGVCLTRAIIMATEGWSRRWGFRGHRGCQLASETLKFLRVVHPHHPHSDVAAYNDCPEMDFDTILRAAKHAEEAV